MKRKIQRIAALLVTAAALAGFASCKSDKKPDDGTKDVPVGSDYPEYLTGKTYGGDTVRFLVASECLYDFTLSEDDEGDDAISAAALKRNQLVSEYHNVRLEFIDGGGINEFNPKMLGVVQAGDPTYDIFCPPYWWNTGNEGVAANLSEISVFDFSQPWWYRYINDELVYPSGNMYYCTGAIDNIDLSSVGVTFVNKTIFADACGDLNVLFEKAKAGEWTKDLALEYAQKFGSDIDANGVMDENDAYGIIVGNGTNMLPSWGVKLSYTKNNDGTYEFNFFNNRFVEKYMALNAFYNDSHVGYTSDWLDWPYKAFSNNRVLFAMAPLNCFTILRGGNADYGILPLPKYDEKQKNYITYGYGILFNGISATASDFERAAVILEAINYQSYKLVLPEYKETTLKYKAIDADDDGTRAMLDIIYASVATDFASVHNERLKVGALCLGHNPSIASLYNSGKDVFNQNLNDLLLGE